jgi:transcription elongation factor GreA
MTEKGRRMLEEQLARLEAERPGILDHIKEAREKGDLSENAEYHAAREALGMLEARIADVKGKLARAQIVDPRRAPRDRVAFGARVRLLNLNEGREEVLELVGAGEDDASAGKILTTSPIAQGLMAKKVGQEAVVRVPMGEVRYRILEITYPA